MRRRPETIVAQHLRQLQRVHHRFPARLIVCEDKRGGRVLLDILDAMLPFLKLLRGVEIIVRGRGPGRPAELALPMLRVAPMQPDISDPRSQQWKLGACPWYTAPGRYSRIRRDSR